MDLLAQSGYASSSSSSGDDSDGGDGSLKFPGDNSALASTVSGLTTDDGGTTEEGDGDSLSEQAPPFPTIPARPVPLAPAPVPTTPAPILVTPAPAAPASQTPVPAVTPALQTSVPVTPSPGTPATAKPAPASTPLRCSGRAKPWPVLYQRLASRVTENGVAAIRSPGEMTRLCSYGRRLAYDDEDGAIDDGEDEEFDYEDEVNGDDEDEASEGLKEPLLTRRAPSKGTGKRKRSRGPRLRRPGGRARAKRTPTKRPKRTNLPAERFSAGEEWRVVDAGKGDAKFGDGVVTEMHVDTTQAPENSLLSFFLGKRVRVVVRKSSQGEVPPSFERVITDGDGNKFELGEIPHDVVFVTEASAHFKKDGIEKVFVTRSPCIKTSDGCVVPVLVDRPDEMSEESWAWLNGLPFGNIVFGRPKPGTTPLVTRIAKSDMDGDRLFVCWNKAIVHGVRRPLGERDPVAEQMLEEEEVETAPTCAGDWFETVKEKMSESSVVMEEIATLKSALWRLSTKAADESMPPLKSAAFMSNPDSIAYADAFYQALEFMKHGRKIILPARLHNNLEKRLRKHLSAS